MSDMETMRTRISDELERQRSDIIGSPSLSVGYVINREINSAIQHYESTRMRFNEVRESEFATTVSATRNYSLPVGFIKMDSLKLIYSGSYIRLRPRTWEQMEEKDRDVTGADGIPTTYAIYGNSLRVYPNPNGAYTLVASYIKRFRPTSLSGSYCAIVTMGGGSLTATSTLSHNNPSNGWTTDAEELIRSRARAAVEINYLDNEQSIGEMRMLLGAREPYFSIRERLAFERLADETRDAQATGYVQPYPI